MAAGQNVLRLAPSLVITRAEVDAAVEMLDRTFAKAAERLRAAAPAK